VGPVRGPALAALTTTQDWLRVVQCGKTDQVISGPPRQALAWIEDRIGGVSVTTTRSLHGGESPWRVDLQPASGVEFAVVFRSPSSRIGREMIATNVSALQVAEQYGLPAPRLLCADVDGSDAGLPASVESVVEGMSAWPAESHTGLLRAAGAAIARVHGVVLEPRPDLPFRPRPIAVDDFAQERRLGRMPTTELLRSADELMQALPVPAEPLVFVHGDVWPGNTLVAGSRIRALIDWKTAGVGDPGVDLGELRKQVAIAYGAEAPRYVLEGWERATGSQARDVAYWDATAALNTPTESVGPVEAIRRDAFLRAALTHL
jgi:aminoglycoside phosphotransferase (APT) family kinase protein